MTMTKLRKENIGKMRIKLYEHVFQKPGKKKARKLYAIKKKSRK